MTYVKTFDVRINLLKWIIHFLCHIRNTYLFRQSLLLQILHNGAYTLIQNFKLIWLPRLKAYSNTFMNWKILLLSIIVNSNYRFC